MRGALALCDALDVGLVAWLDLDFELRRAEYGARFHVFSMLWESCWRGRSASDTEGRLVLVQSRRSGGAWRDSLARGWGAFWRDELNNRRALDLPPFGLLVQIEPSRGEDRGESGTWCSWHHCHIAKRCALSLKHITDAQRPPPSIHDYHE